MSYQIIFTQGSATVVVPAGERIAVQSYSPAIVSQVVGFPNMPPTRTVLATVENTTFVSAAFANGATIFIEAGASNVYFSVGVSPDISFDNGKWQPQAAPSNIPDGAAMIMTAGELLNGLVTATPTVARNVQMPLGTNLELATEWAIDEGFDFSLITLAAFALTLTVNTGVTIVGSPATAATAGAAAMFRVRKTALNTFIVYRLN
jgi:hypothetical protein